MMRLLRAVRLRVVRFVQSLLWYALSQFGLHLNTRASRSDPSPKNASSNSGEIAPRALADTAGEMGFVSKIEQGNTLAAYSFRFVAMPFNFFCEGIQDLTQLTCEELAKKLETDPILLGKLVDEFYTRAQRQEFKTKGIEYLREELFHHDHLSSTSLAAFSQTSALFMRFAFTYLALKRISRSDRQGLVDDLDYVDVCQFLLNLYFSTTEIKAHSMPVIEGYARFTNRDEERRIIPNYGPATAEAAKSFRHIEDSVLTNNSLNKHLSTTQIAKEVLKIPFVSSNILEPLSFIAIRKKFKNERVNPFLRLVRCSEILLKQEPSDELIAEIAEATPTATFDNNLSTMAAWFGTRSFIPPQILSMAFIKLILTREGMRSWGRLISSIFSGGGQRIERVASQDFPGLRMYGPSGKALMYDPFATLFSGRTSTTKLVTSFEFIILPSPKYVRYIQIESILLRFIGANFRGASSQLWSYIHFILLWLAELKPNKDRIEEWLHWADDRSIELSNMMRENLRAGTDPFAGDNLLKFIRLFDSLFGECVDSLNNKGVGLEVNMIYSSMIDYIGDCFYIHGL